MNKRRQPFFNTVALKKLFKANANRQYARRKTNQTQKIRDGKWYKEIKITDWGMLLTTIVLTFGTLKLYYEAVNQSSISKQAADAATLAANLAKSADSLNLEMFKASHSAVVTLDRTFVWRHPFRNVAFYGRRRIQLQFNLFNNTPNTIEVPYFKYKILFQLDKSVIDSGFYKGIKLDSTFIEGKQNFILDNTTPDGALRVINLQVDTTLNEVDSANLERNQNIVFLEIHYINLITREKFKFQFIGTIDGENKKHDNGEFWDLRKDWKVRYWNKTSLPDK